MKCPNPNCPAHMTESGIDDGHGWWCENCGTSADAQGWHSIPAQAKSHAALLAFKSWVHQYLDARGVPHHPPGPHGAEGCRIGDRMDWLMASHAALREAAGQVSDETGCYCYDEPRIRPSETCGVCRVRAALRTAPK